MTTISTLLIANRGEIALRIMRTAREMGLKTIAVYSEADADAPHVRFADDAVCLGPAPVAESYLAGDKIIDAARSKGADAIHPGYGFLSENGAFARSVVDAGVVFVGPPAAAIDIMGDKAQAKRWMIGAGVPCIPGYEGEDQTLEVFEAAASEIGFPVMVKASAGGGGRGMRLVEQAADLADAIKLARSEAENAFGSGELILEKAIVQSRHVEMQVFADNHGNAIHLGERDCSIQRRHQKIVEEAPCPVMTADLRAAMGAAAVEAARAVEYRGAGTVEFLLDPEGQFYFLEMNTRLQVEHPVTELVTGLDLVALQLAVAEGRPLALTQDEVRFEGHAMEVRLYAEDPTEDFLPSTGLVHFWQPPEGIVSGGEVSPYYDAIVAKIITSGSTREEARLKLVAALRDTVLFGPASNRDFLIDVLKQPLFVAGAATTAFIAETYGDGGYESGGLRAEELAVAAVVQHACTQLAASAKANVSEELLDWSSAGDLETILRYPLLGETKTVSVRPRGARDYDVTVEDTVLRVTLFSMDSNRLEVVVDGNARRGAYWMSATERLFINLESRSFTVIDAAALDSNAEEAGGGGVVVAPMHGLLLAILVTEGDRVRKGDRLAVLEAMKMQHEILAEVDGSVIRVAAAEDTQVAANDLILEIEPTEDA